MRGTVWGLAPPSQPSHPPEVLVGLQELRGFSHLQLFPCFITSPV